MSKLAGNHQLTKEASKHCGKLGELEEKLTDEVTSEIE